MAAPIIISALGGGEWSASCSNCFNTGEIALSIHWIEGRVGSGRRGKDKKSPFLPLPGIKPQSSSP